MHFSKKGFTLVEIMISIAIIAIILGGIMSVKFTPSYKEELNAFDVKVLAPINDAKNSALVGKGVTKNGELQIPDTWNVMINKATDNNGHKGMITTYYKLENDNTIYAKEEKKFPSDSKFSIKEISYKTFDSDDLNKIESNGYITLSFKGPNVGIQNGADDDDGTIKEIVICTTIQDKMYNKITINKVSGVVTKEIAKISECR